MTVSTGNSALDDVLGGGLPERRTTLVTGGPGTGKSTLGMQFLDAALERGEECLFVSTEQSTEDVRESFADFAFDVDHENLTIASIHAASGTTLEGEDSLVLSELGEGEGPFGGFIAPYEQQYVQRFLERYEDADCVVFDSASALLDLPGGRETARSSALELMEFFQHSMEATTLMTAEGRDVDPGVQRTLAYAAHGVVQLDTEVRDGQSIRTLRVVKLRGADHDRRKYAVQLDESGFKVVPEHRSPLHATGVPGTISTGVPGLANVVPGIPTGGASLVEHDGDANVEHFATAALVEAIETDRRAVLVPSRFLTHDALDDVLPADVPDVEALLDDGSLIVVDPFGSWDATHENVVHFGVGESVFGIVTGRLSPVTAFRLFRTVRDVVRKLSGDPTLVLIFLEGLLRRASPSIIQRVSNWTLANHVTDQDAWWVFLNPGVTDESTVEFFRHDTRQRLRTWVDEDGIQRVRLEKGTGELKVDHVVSWTDEPPYLRVERPF